MRRAFSPGFTLIEIMVALAIITLTLGAIIENTTASNRNAQYLRDKTIAAWVGSNEITLMRAKREWGGVSNKSGEAEMAGQTWQWRMAIRKTDNADMRRLDVQVFKDGADDPLVTMSGFMGRL